MERTGSKALVSVAPGILTWARESIGLPIDVAAKRLGIKPETLESMEDGTKPVSIGKIRQMAKHYDRPLIAFFLPGPPREPDLLPDFRVIHEHESRAWSPQLNRAYRRVLGQREVMLSIESALDEPIPRVEFRLERPATDADTAGEAIRAWLNPSDVTGNRSYAVLGTWIAAIEAKGILVAQMSDVSIQEARGFSIGQHPLPVITVNGAEPPTGKLFTLLHELVHVLLNGGGLCDLEDTGATGNATEGQHLEWYCNSVAAATLLPRSEVLQEVAGKSADRNSRWSHDDLAKLASHFGVSPEAMLVRLVTMNLASRDYYRERRPEFLERYREQRSARTGFLTYYREQIRNMSRRYIESVWRAYERGENTDPDLSTYLNTKLENVPKLIEKARVA